MVRVEVCKEDAVYGQRVQARAEHAAYGPRTEVEDQGLPPSANHDAALAPFEAGNYGAGSYDGDLDGFLPSVVTAFQHAPCRALVSNSACRVFSLVRYVEFYLGWLLFERPSKSGDAEQGAA